MDQLGGVEELLAADHDLPLDLQAGILHQWHERVEDLRHAAPHGGGADVQDPLALQWLGKLLDLLDQRASCQVSVIS
ncbi:hypothetical protein LCGC14_2836860 [marine sediment metagenome]|uniref:Uncharacterized protein n=1 Tax=marine sediment metagenome TaxID=412755 RepID=A0A0F8YZ05_9ZZZZ